jgi:ribosome-associated translation inhibitor RaiA
MYASIDEAFSKIEHRLTRYHDKLVKSRARRGHKAAEVDKEPQ